MVEGKLRDRLLTPGYGSPIRAERFIAIGRVLLAVLSLMAIRLDPLTPARYTSATDLLLSGYAAYAIALALIFWWRYGLLVRLRLATHVLDLALFTLFMYLTEGPSSPFFAYFTFALVAATLRWQGRGVLWTALAAIVAFNAMGWYAARVMADPAFELNRFMIRTVYLVVIASLLAYVGFYQRRRSAELVRLATWPRAAHQDPAHGLKELLASAAHILNTRRALLVWEEREEPWLHLTLWSPDGLQSWREPPESFQPLIAEPLAESSFLCQDAGADPPVVLHQSSGHWRQWHGPLLNGELRSRFAIRSVLGIPLRGERFQGHLLALDKPWMTADDLVLGEVVARQTAASLELFFVSEQLRQSVALEERVRLARDLHDGLLQSLTGAALKLHTTQRLMQSAPDTARKTLDEIEQLIADEQRDLRLLVEDLKPDPFFAAGAAGSDEAARPAGKARFEASLKELAERVESVWGEGLSVRVQVGEVDLELPHALASQVYRVIREALVNAARHAEAKEVSVQVSVTNGRVRIIVVDNGHGFPFQGAYDHAALVSRHLGPISLRERVTSLGGTLAIDSSPTGARLEILLPQRPSVV